MGQITPKHILDNQILLKLLKIFNSTEINPNTTYSLSEPSVLSCENVEKVYKSAFSQHDKITLIFLASQKADT